MQSKIFQSKTPHYNEKYSFGDYSGDTTLSQNFFKNVREMCYEQ